MAANRGLFDSGATRSVSPLPSWERVARAARRERGPHRDDSSAVDITSMTPRVFLRTSLFQKRRTLKP